MKGKKKSKNKFIAVTCPYCGRTARLTDGESILGERARYSKYYVCSNYPQCDSFVAVHEGTHLPMGPLADVKLRRLRYETHLVFDRLWKEGFMAKDDAYAWLSVKLDLPPSMTHIGLFHEGNCYKTISISNEALSLLLKKGA